MKKFQDRLAETCIRMGVKQEIVNDLIQSGYYLSPLVKSSQPHVADSFYGSKMFSGSMPIDSFFENRLPKANVPTYEVKSLHDIKRILSTERHARFFDAGRMSFRGQNKEYKTKRAFPNPVQVIEGEERLIIPSYWRKFSDNWNERFSCTPYSSIFTSMFGDHLVYYGIPDWKTLSTRNHERYGIHTMSDLEDMPDSESQEYGRRWRKFKIEGQSYRDLPMVEQHYGLDTCGLDVTFDPAVACFFASHEFKSREDKTAYYKPITDGTHEGVIYGFVFRSPSLNKTSEMVESLHLFDHIPPLRPKRQQCALPFFHDTTMNEAVSDLDFVMYFSKDFDISNLPSAQLLFPDTDEDLFYRAILEVKKELNDRKPYNKFVEYRFE